MNRAPRGVWAPFASRVELEVEGARFLLVPGREGHFRMEADAAARLVPGARYGFLLDGAGPFPDPRSRDQPDGVFALSRVVDDQFPWRSAAFRAPPIGSSVFYEMHVGTFTPEGTFDAAVERLGHLVELGVTHVQLMPVCSFAGDFGWGYDGVFLFAPHARYGGPDGLRRFIDACHVCGLAVFIDVVYNHVGPRGNVLPRYGPYLSTRHHTPWGPAFNFDEEGSDDARGFLLDNARMWFEEFRADGLRLDAIHGMADRTALPFAEELALAVARMGAALGRPLSLIAESDLNDPRVLRSRDAGGFGLDAQWSDDLHHALHVALTGERARYYADFGGLRDVAHVLQSGWLYEGQWSAYRRRRHGRPLRGELRSKLVVSAQNHDQVGNRVRGDRMAAVVGPEGAMAALAVTLFSPFIPLLFQGEEWGAQTPFQYFCDLRDEETATLVRAGRSRELGATPGLPPADPVDPRTFEDSRLRWGDRSNAAHGEVLRFVRALLRLRRESPALCDGDVSAVRCAVGDADDWLRVERGSFTLAVNLGPAQEIPVRPGGELVVASRPGVALRDGWVLLAPDCVAVMRHA